MSNIAMPASRTNSTASIYADSQDPEPRFTLPPVNAEVYEVGGLVEGR